MVPSSHRRAEDRARSFTSFRMTKVLRWLAIGGQKVSVDCSHIDVPELPLRRPSSGTQRAGPVLREKAM